MQVVGFSPADLSNVYEEVSLQKEFERDVLQRRARLLNKFNMAKKAGDTDLEEEVRAEIDAFNEDRENPKARIRPDTLRRSEAARKAYEDNTINGVRFNKSLMSEIDDLMEE
jgi:TPP-dependent pyruvate/acetoin dehydrogenase alpha subunit